MAVAYASAGIESLAPATNLRDDRTQTGSVLGVPARVIEAFLPWQFIDRWLLNLRAHGVSTKREILYDCASGNCIGKQ